MAKSTLVISFTDTDKGVAVSLDCPEFVNMPHKIDDLTSAEALSLELMIQLAQDLGMDESRTIQTHVEH